MSSRERMEQRIQPLLDAARILFESGDFNGAGELYKRVLRDIRDTFGSEDQRIADVFELLGEVHVATGRPLKFRSVCRRVAYLRALV